ncbi:hypothetical protein [Kitasatospora sp. McL0602]|uniref:hypothetical protein n=1 Tax=Kitasatospora sp. McL0602 TaxID=3439530 RepID=UPI003F887F04
MTTARLLLAGRRVVILDEAAADQILVVEVGHIVERGAHDDLIAQAGRFICRNATGH